MSLEDKPVAWPEPQEIPSKENSGAADAVYIPDYVMHDFGSPKPLAPTGSRGLSAGATARASGLCCPQ
jgi:hypothetical protein